MEYNNYWCTLIFDMKDKQIQQSTTIKPEQQYNNQPPYDITFDVMEYSNYHWQTSSKYNNQPPYNLCTRLRLQAKKIQVTWKEHCMVMH